MIILSTLSLLISNAVISRRDMAILYNRIAIITLLYAILQSLISYSICNGCIDLHVIVFDVINIRQVFYLVVLCLLVFIDFKFDYLYSLCSQIYKNISMATPAGAPLHFGILFLIQEIAIKLYIKNKAFFVAKNYCFIQLDKTILGIVLYMFIYIITVFILIFFYNGSIGIFINFNSFSKVELLAFFLCIFIVFIGFLSKGVSSMIDFIYEYINTLINIIMILGVILIYLYLVFDINLNVVFLSLLYFRYFIFIMFILISLFIISSLNIRSLFDILLIFSLSYLISKFLTFLCLVLFVNLINDFNLTFTTGSISFGSSSQDIKNFNLLDNLLDKGAKALLENRLYFPATPEFNEYINYIPEINNNNTFVNLFNSVFKLLFNIANNKSMYIPSVFQTSSLPIIINVKLGIINESPILIQVLNSNLKILGGASIGGGESYLPNLLPEPIFIFAEGTYEIGSLGHWLFIENMDKMRNLVDNYEWPANLTRICVTTDQKIVFDYLLSFLQEKSEGLDLVCFRESSVKNYLYVINYNDIYVNNKNKISLFFKMPRSSPDVIPNQFTIQQDITTYINNLTVNTNSEYYWITGVLECPGIDGQINTEYCAYVHVKDQDIFNVNTIREKSINNFYTGASFRSTFDPLNYNCCNKPMAIHDHHARTRLRRVKLPFSSPPCIIFNSDINFCVTNTNDWTKNIYYYFGLSNMS